MGDGARYWRLIEVGVEYDETIKSPCDGRGLGGVNLPPSQKRLYLIQRLGGLFSSPPSEKVSKLGIL